MTDNIAEQLRELAAKIEEDEESDDEDDVITTINGYEMVEEFDVLFNSDVYVDRDGDVWFEALSGVDGDEPQHLSRSELRELLKLSDEVIENDEYKHLDNYTLPPFSPLLYDGNMTDNIAEQLRELADEIEAQQENEEDEPEVIAEIDGYQMVKEADVTFGADVYFNEEGDIFINGIKDGVSYFFSSELEELAERGREIADN